MQLAAQLWIKVPVVAATDCRNGARRPQTNALTWPHADKAHTDSAGQTSGVSTLPDWHPCVGLHMCVCFFPPATYPLPRPPGHLFLDVLVETIEKPVPTCLWSAGQRRKDLRLPLIYDLPCEINCLPASCWADTEAGALPGPMASERVVDLAETGRTGQTSLGTADSSRSGWLIPFFCPQPYAYSSTQYLPRGIPFVPPL
ncbi:unnamed protein product [Protopolystoma xenopodis]|uniref:Uncharacterized protein n=1 Tax=Protopolystoma xenopodis TaxID=117903 RepID=A0A448WIG5_9PLAT|nr:unnamed protein product [Protopolystoma xenopodis]